jgi:hypothetical protein
MATRDAALELVRAHLDLARTELSAIAGQVGRMVGLFAAAFFLVLLALTLLGIGGTLFLGEWLFGSMGWGILHGVLLLAGIAVAAVLLAIGVGGGRIGLVFVIGVVAAIVVGVALGFHWPNQAYAGLGESARLNVETGVRPLVVGVLIGALVGLLIGFALAVRIDSGGGRLAAIVGLAILGAIAGAISAITFGPQVGAAVGIAVGILVWIGLMAADVVRNGFDAEGLKDRFTPTQTIDTGKETLEWLQRRMPPGIGS